VNVEHITAERAIDFPEDWYDANSEQHFWFQWRARVARRLIDACGLRTDQPLKAVDIGCGTGITCRQLARFTRWTFDGVDLNVAALRRCDVGGGGRVLYYDILERRPELAAAYDVALLFDVLEHIEEPRPFLEAVLFHLRPGGVLLVNVPALMALYGVYDRVAGHFRRYTFSTLAREFAGLPVAILDHRYWGFSMVPLLGTRTLLLRSGEDDAAVIRKGFVPPHRWVHACMKGMMRIETRLAPKPPFGSSVMLAVRNTADAVEVPRIR
jgi:SAM-dependent methyltransferase